MAHSGDRLPGSSLALSMSELWQVIKEQRDLNLPAHKVRWPSDTPQICSIKTGVQQQRLWPVAVHML